MSNFASCGVSDRFANLKAMNELIKSMNNEDAYFEWINLIPDQACDEDLLDIAQDQELFDDSVNLFIRLCEEYIEDGLFIGGILYGGD